MPLVTSKELFKKAQDGHYAVGAFSVENMEMAQAVIWAAQETGSPVIVQTTSSTLRYAEPSLYQANVAALAQEATVPVVMHLDHGNSYDLAIKCMEAGYTSVMIDGSALSFDENAALTERVVEAAQKLGIPVEAELGKVGGKEDDLSVDEDVYTDPQAALEFVARTGVSSLAVSIGTAHGVYAKAPVLDKNRLTEIRELVDVPLVLHGASGLADKDVQDCISRGICKVNFATELRIAFMDGVKEALAADPKLFDPKIPGKLGREHVQKLAGQKMVMCGCAGKY